MSQPISTSTEPRVEPIDASGLLRLVDGLPAMVAYWDLELHCRFANRVYETWFAVSAEQMVGMRMQDLLGPLFALNKPYIDAALRGEPQTFEREIPDPLGGPSRYSQAHYIPDVVDGAVRGFSVLVVDITRRCAAEQALLDLQRRVHDSERVATLTTLAVGMAHEINNPLAAILANIELAMSSDDPTHVHDGLADARIAALRIRDIVRSMQLLARHPSPHVEVVDVREVVEQSLEVAASAIRYRAVLVRELNVSGFVGARGAQLGQALVNILVNATQALPEATAERNLIRVSTQREGTAIVIEIADNGVGIPPDVLPRIFDPFFTTRDVGAGLGLGLAVAHGIVTSFGGAISVHSQLGEGTTFRVALPEREAPPSGAVSVIDQERPVKPSVRRRILLVDDDAAVLRSLRRLLDRDHDVVAVSDPHEAVTQAARSDYDLILCDLMMPGMSGEDVYNAIVGARAEYANAFIFMTGGAFTSRGQAFLDASQRPLIEKPFAVATVRSVVAAHMQGLGGPSE